MSNNLSTILPTPLNIHNKTIQQQHLKNTSNTSPFYSNNDSKMEPKGVHWSGLFRQGRLPGPPRAPNASKDDPRTQNHRKSDLQAPKIHEQTKTKMKKTRTLDPFQVNKKTTIQTNTPHQPDTPKQNKTADPRNQTNKARRNARSD